jgi:hypothetical protein
VWAPRVGFSVRAGAFVDQVEAVRDARDASIESVEPTCEADCCVPPTATAAPSRSTDPHRRHRHKCWRHRPERTLWGWQRCVRDVGLVAGIRCRNAVGRRRDPCCRACWSMSVGPNTRADAGPVARRPSRQRCFVLMAAISGPFARPFTDQVRTYVPAQPTTSDRRRGLAGRPRSTRAHQWFEIEALCRSLTIRPGRAAFKPWSGCVTAPA